MDNRTFLKKKITLWGESDGGRYQRTFEIHRKISAGSSIISYEASHGQSGRGVLKEFYPANAITLERNKQGQLIHGEGFGGAKDRFAEMRSRYLEPYQLVLEALRLGECEGLETFLPKFEIFYGSDEDPMSARTVYIWTNEPKSKTFAEICDEIHARPGEHPEYKLVCVLNAMVSLTQCIRMMHNAGMIHRDINPGNFGFASREDEVLTQSISLFDINTVCDLYPLPTDRVGTPGYEEPEITENTGEKYVGSCKTDIYSIGATLFHAIVVTDETKQGNYLYRKEYRGQVGRMLAESRLITASEGNSHPKLRKFLARVLEKSLCPRDQRYRNCDELLEDLNQALYYALPTQVARSARSGDRWVLKGAEEFLDTKQEKNAAIALSYHLYHTPLYRYCGESEKDLNLMLLGFGKYGRQFLDISLTIGQMQGKMLHVTVLSDDEEDQRQYLEERPELANFFQIGSHDHCGAGCYGSICFETTILSGSGMEENTALIQDIIVQKQESRYPPHYIFVALGDPELTLNAACASHEAAQILDMPCSVNFAWEEETLEQALPEGLNPVYVCADVTNSKFHGEIERMAFNVHLTWEKNLNIDYSAVRAEFRKPYNHASCVSNVLSLKYKLYSMGIDLDKVDLDTAAQLFSRRKPDKNLRSQLIWVEHRRWVAEKIVAGWQRIGDLEQCIGGRTKDERGRRHVCIVPSEPNQKLAAEYCQNGSYAKWDNATEAELSKLDELDRLSIRMHRMYVRKAEEMRGMDLLSHSGVAGLRAKIGDGRRTVVAFQEWYTCLKEIWNRDYSKVRLYEGLKKAFLEAAAEELPKQISRSIADQVKAFDAMFHPILASMEYRDFKQDDVALVDNIPFILTYSDSIYLAVPFATGTNTQVFSNIAAAAVVNPARILFLCYLESPEKAGEIKEVLPCLTAFMKKKRFRAGLEFIIGCTPRTAAALEGTLEKQLRERAGGCLRQVKLLPVEHLGALPAAMAEYLTSRKSRKRRFALEKNETNLSYLLQGAGAYENFASYRFDAVSMKFHDCDNCRTLTYIRKKPSISVADVAAFSRSTSDSSNHPEFFADYKELWKKYREPRSVWKFTCDILGEYARTNDVIAVFGKKSDWEKAEPTALRYILPFDCCRTVSRLVEFLVGHGIAEKDSRVCGYTTDSCEVLIWDRCGYRSRYDKLFSQPYRLMAPEAVDIHLNTKSREAVVVFDNLIVDGVQVTGNRRDDIFALMRYFAGRGYVTNLVIQNDTMRFTYATRQIKELLTTAGKILEVYTYHKAKETGRFDDVVSGYEIDWENTGVKSELDCILTKGLSTLFVECKARRSIEQDFYYKLASLAQQFGINARAVLIADTQERSGQDTTAVNQMQRMRGGMLDVITIWDPQEIQEIGATLLKVINGTYVPK